LSTSALYIDNPRTRTSILRSAALVVLWLALFQPFFYLNDFYTLYVIAKAGVPVIGFVATYLLILCFSLGKSLYPYTLTILIATLYFTVSPALASYWQHNQSLPYGLTSEAKIFPLLFYFAAFYVFRKWRVNPHEMEITFALLAWVTIAIGSGLEFLVDPEFLKTDDGVFVIFDEVRGYRYNMPLIFVELYSLIVFRRSLEQKSWAAALQLLPIFGYLVLIAEQRLSVFGLVVVMCLASLRYASLRSLLVLLACIIVPAGGLILMKADYFALVEVAAAFAFRLNTVTTIFDFLGSDLLRWLFGAGHLNPLSGTTIQDVYGPNFWPSDVGWIGILYEFGLLGVVATAVMYGLLIRESEKYTQHADSHVLLGLKDYVRKVVIVSIFIPFFPYLTGIYATLLALFVSWRLVGNPEIVEHRRVRQS
jgi:hypothetical protein